MKRKILFICVLVSLIGTIAEAKTDTINVLSEAYNKFQTTEPTEKKQAFKKAIISGRRAIVKFLMKENYITQSQYAYMLNDKKLNNLVVLKYGEGDYASYVITDYDYLRVANNRLPRRPEKYIFDGANIQ
jgi:hypothetical protein